MRKVVYVSGLVLCFGAFVLSGCAKQELVKKDEPVVAAPESTPAKQPEPVKPPVKEEPVASSTIKEAPVVRDETSASSGFKEQTEKLMGTIYFDFDSSTLSQTSRDTLSASADVLIKKKPTLKIQIEGHCDERGSAEYNLALGERRAKSAMSYLVTLGVAADRISTISYGEEKPADPGHDEAAWAKNRRDEFLIAK